MTSRTKKSLLNFTTSSLKTFGILIVSFVATPLLLKFIGPDRFGTFKVLTEIQSYLGLAEMGLLGGIAASIFSLSHGPDENALMKLLSEAKRSYYRITVFTLLAGVCILPFLRKLTSWPFPDSWDLYVSFILIFSSALFLPSNLHRVYIDIKNRGYVLHVTGLLQSLSFTIIGISLAYLGFQMTSQAIATFISGALGAYLLHRKSGIKIALSPPEPELRKKISSHQKPQVLNELAGKFCYSSDQIILSMILGPLAVTKVFLSQRVVQLMQQQIVSLGQSLYASLGSIYYEEDRGKEKFAERLLEVSKMISMVAVAGLVPICVLNEAFIELWVGKDFLPANAQQIVYVSAMNAFFMGIFSFWGYLFTVLGRAGEMTRQFYFQALINVCVSILATYKLGLIGPLLGTLTSFILIPSWVYPHLLHKNFSVPLVRLFASIYVPVLAGIAMILLIQQSPLQVHHLGWIKFCLTGALIFIANALVTFILLFNKNEKVQFLNRIRKLLERK